MFTRTLNHWKYTLKYNLQKNKTFQRTLMTGDYKDNLVNIKYIIIITKVKNSKVNLFNSFKKQKII